MMPLNRGRQSLGGCPPLGLGCPSSRRMGSMRAQRSSETSQMVFRGLGWERFRGMREFLLGCPPNYSQCSPQLQERF
jgi:hypothetical protein